MREHPLLLVLDEPTAALDAEAEHAVFERYAAAAQAGVGGAEGALWGSGPGRLGAEGDSGGGRAPGDADGRITLLVSHRFSTVRMADLIVVLDGSRVVEVGPHDELLDRHGPYAELYGIQAAAYR
jgi:ATP-binding cassette subfamily B protein